MKIVKSIINWVLTIIVVFIFLGILVVGLAFMPNRVADESMAQYLDAEIVATDLLENLLDDMDADSNSLSAVFNDKEIAPIVNGGLKRAFENDETITVNYGYLTFEKDKIIFTMHVDIKTPVMSYPTKIVVAADFGFDGENMVFAVKDIYVGRIPVSKSMVGMFAKRFESSESLKKLGTFDASNMSMKVPVSSMLDSLNGILTLVDSQVTNEGWRFSFEINLAPAGGEN